MGKTEKRKNDLKRTRGSILFMGIILAFIGMVILAGLYFHYVKSLHIIFPVKTYATLRDAAVGTVHMVTHYIDNGYFRTIDNDPCPPGTTNVNATDENATLASAIRCCETSINFRLVGYSETFPADTVVCLLGTQPHISAGSSPDPVVKGGGPSGSESKPKKYIYSIATNAKGPRGTLSYVEAVYESPPQQ
uniref:Uncharacterized protein n=1 Tax=Caldimicrobium thiodismutans TaxID=1653476 RepID=A0A832GRU7_9BACT